MRLLAPGNYSGNGNPEITRQEARRPGT